MSDHELLENEWDTSTGLALDGMEAEITGFEFGFNSKLGADRLCANVTFTPLEEGEPVEQSFTVGKNWEVDADGWLVPENGKLRPIGKQSNFGILINSAITAVQAANAEFPFRTPRDAAAWLGTKWKIGTIKVTGRKNIETGEEKDADAFIFSAYLGAAGSKPNEKKASAGAGSKGSGGGKLDADLRKKLLKLAITSDSPDDFAETALALDAVKDSEAAQKVVLDGSLYAEANG